MNKSRVQPSTTRKSEYRILPRFDEHLLDDDLETSTERFLFVKVALITQDSDDWKVTIKGRLAIDSAI